MIQLKEELNLQFCWASVILSIYYCILIVTHFIIIVLCCLWTDFVPEAIHNEVTMKLLVSGL